MTCSICQSKNVQFKFDFTDKLKIFSCSSCGVEFLNPQLSDSEITELYSETYYKSWGIEGAEENESSRQMKIATFLLRLELIKKYRNSGKVLDVGCATGYFLEAAKMNHYDVFGVELSEYSSNIAKSKFGNEAIFNGKLEDCHFSPGMFDAITMFDLIEHVRSPEQTLKDAAKLLADDGIILITTPNNNSISNKVMDKKWTHYKKEHFFYFDIQSLTYIAQKANLQVVYSEHSKKALNLKYLHTQFNVYKHRLFTPLVNGLCAIFPNSMLHKNFHISIGEITVVLKKNKA